LRRKPLAIDLAEVNFDVDPEPFSPVTDAFELTPGSRGIYRRPSALRDVRSA